MTPCQTEREPRTTDGKPPPTGGEEAREGSGYRAPHFHWRPLSGDPVIQIPRPGMSPARRFGLAVALSVIAHLALITALTRPAAGLRVGNAGAPAPRLVARLVTPPRQAASAAPPAAHPAPASPAPTLPGPVPAVRAPLPEAAAQAVDAIPLAYHPLASLSREPELISAADPADWPPLPDAPTGSFQLELGIGADGRVDLVVPRCEAALCPAARIYADIVRGWRFQPAELLGRPAPSRLRLEFEVGIAAPPAADQAPRQ